ncbi:hypothetical protein CXB51_031110 [Gossypium anomalum]|uniref:Uncharacterized protein n=1 Tax=Gossypium anomalum TaxID=47600 RepID=A0A8J5XW59_9ROSI|nr:hypothetical protein CXB51_031110 [Gossypium anomalum]
MDSYRVLRGRVNSIRFQPDERLILFLELAGRAIASGDPHISFAVRECTITLEDVIQLRLPIDGNAITGVSSISRPATLCYELLGRSPSEGKFASLRLSWLKPNFQYLPSTTNEREVMQAVRAYIMHLIGGLGVRSVSHVVLRTLSDGRSFCDGHRRMSHAVAVVGTLPDAILGIN